ncbi:NACHT domain-containing NTPase [Streptomyces sp. NBC_00878]|uniref:NACHT domain-containing protein n=1 Tax=Streptomyces sp. NBC_00878 TaxID=2975854 RepID=UPI002258230B|nr:NACHT domain-containing protein [Streptomyces sp. NBC_00878]MCX4909128.1 NACHT domain-containing protein [Streptomyces sp. NBC_00878]
MAWREEGNDFVSTASSILATGVSLFGVLSAWASRRSAQQGRSTTDQLTEAQAALARLVESQWRKEAGLRQLHNPVPLPVSWSDSPDVGVHDHPELIGGTISCQADQGEELAAAFRQQLPRRRLIVLGPAGSGKTTFAVLLALSLLQNRPDNEPVPVLLTATSFNPEQESVHDWLRRRITADYPTLADADTYGPTAIDDLLAGHRVLPVIDGLDELPKEVHASVLTALNETLDTDAPLVLTSRTGEYTTAAASARALSGAAVIAPGNLSVQDSLALLRLATPTGPSQQRWDSLAEHLAAHPAGAAAQALTSPLTVALARTVYAEGTGNPEELGNFESKEAIEDHLLDALIPIVYATARRRDPAKHPWSPEHAHRYLAQLASGMQRQRTTDLEWWRIHQWVPVVSRPWARGAVWAVTVFVLTLAGYAIGRALPEYSPERLESLEWIPGSVAVALPCMCWLAAWTATRCRLRARRLTSTVLIAVGGAVAFAVPGMMVDRADELPNVFYAIACLLFWGFTFLLVLHSAGPPAPPLLPSRGTLIPGNWPRRLLLAVATFLGTTALATAAFQLYALALVTPGQPAHAVELPWAHGLILGALFGALQALLHWMRGTTSKEEVTSPVSTVRADRLVTLVGCGGGFLLATLPYTLAFVLRRTLHELQEVSPLTIFVCTLLGVGPTGLILGLAAHAWPYYMAARLLLSAQGQLPWRLQSFLTNAHRLGVLRQVGPVYQFRHARLQEHLARPVQVPGPRAASSDPDLEPGSASLR